MCYGPAVRQSTEKEILKSPAMKQILFLFILPNVLPSDSVKMNQDVYEYLLR